MKLYKITHARIQINKEPIVYIVAKNMADLEFKLKQHLDDDWIFNEPMTIDVVVNDLFQLIDKCEAMK